MKTILICFLTICFLFSFISVANADIFKVEPEISYNNLKINGGRIPDFTASEPVLMLGADSEIDLKFFRLGLDLDYGNIQDFSYLMVTPRVGWEFGFLDYTIKIYESYQILNLTDLASPVLTHVFSGFLFSAEIESKISEMFAYYGTFTIPETLAYSRNGELNKDDEINRSNWSIGIKYTPLPLYDILIEYHVSQVFDKTQKLEIALNGVTASVNILF